VWDSTGNKGEVEYYEARGLPPPGPGAFHQLLHGLQLPIHLARALFQDADARRRYLRVCTAQLVVIAGLGLVFMKSGQEVADDVQERAEQAERAREDRDEEELEAVLEALEKAQAEGGSTIQAVVSALEKEQPTREERVHLAMKRARADIDAALAQARADLAEAQARARRLDEARARGESTSEAELARLRTEAHVAEAKAAAAQAEVLVATARSREAMKQARAQARRDKKPRVHFQKFTVMDLEFWAALLAAMHLTQWVVIALSRDYHDAIARDVSLLTRLKPEDEPLEPRVRLNLPWLRTKLKRRLRGLVLFLMAMPLFWFLVSVPPFLFFRGILLPALTSVWAAWWFVVFASAKSARAWEAEATAGPPWFIRGWTWLTTHVPGFRWSIPRRYGAFLENRTRDVYSPAECVERQPWVFVGLGLARTLTLVPGVKCFIRPLIPVASAHLLEAYKAAHPAAVVVESLPVAAPAVAGEQPAPARVSSGS
jgi:hypothetical protein